MDRDDVLKKLTELDFMAVDLGLYLNTHNYDKRAIAEYNKIIEAANIVRCKYEEMYGPLCSFRSIAPSSEKWVWSDNPWPYDKSFNFDLNMKECM